MAKCDKGHTMLEGTNLCFVCAAPRLTWWERVLCLWPIVVGIGVFVNTVAIITWCGYGVYLLILWVITNVS